MRSPAKYRRVRGFRALLRRIHAGRHSLTGSTPQPLPKGHHDYALRAGASPVTAVETALTWPEAGAEPGPDDPIEMVYQLHGRPLYRFLLRVTFADRREAEDLLQETLLRAWRYLQDHTADVTHLRPWLYTVARRVAIDAARARQARPGEVTVTDPDTLPAAHDDIERLLLVLTMRHGLMSLTPPHPPALLEGLYPRPPPP